MPSVTNKGVSKIASTLTLGAGVVTTRAHAHWFVTEYGAVNLYGKSLQERARLIISVAHPDHQEELDKALSSATEHTTLISKPLRRLNKAEGYANNSPGTFKFRGCLYLGVVTVPLSREIAESIF